MKKGFKRETQGRGLSFLAKNGHEVLIVWVETLRGRFMQPQLNAMFAKACRGGHVGLARLLQGRGARDLYNALWSVCRGGNVETLLQLWKWEDAEPESSWMETTGKLEMMNIAARAGHRELVTMIWERASRENLNTRALAQYAFDGAARGGHADIMQLARGWGAVLGSEGFVRAAEGGHTEIVRTLLASEASTSVVRPLWVQDALEAAVIGGHCHTVDLLLANGARASDSVLSVAAQSGKRALLEKIVARSAPLNAWQVGYVLVGAIEGGHLPLCLYARGLGARVTSNDFGIAASSGHGSLLQQLHEWYQVDSGRTGESNDDIYYPPLREVLWTAFTAVNDGEKVSRAHTEVMKVLRSLGAKMLDSNGISSPLACAAELGEMEQLRLIQQWCVEDGAPLYYSEAMVLAAGKGQEDAMLQLQHWSRNAEGRFAPLCYEGAYARAAENKQSWAKLLLEQWAREAGRPLAASSPFVKNCGHKYCRAAPLVRETPTNDPGWLGDA
jgi:hypothetical protein